MNTHLKNEKSTVENYFNQKTKTLNPYLLSKRFGGNFSDKTSPLDWNESLFGPTDRLKKEIIDYINNTDLNLYPDGDLPELNIKISKYNNLNEKQILVFNGSDSALHDCIHALISQGDKVTIIEPEYNQVDTFIHMAGGEKVSFLPDDIYNLNIDKIIKFIEEQNSKYIYLSNPSNPVGRFIEIQDIKKLLDSGVFLLLDEAYIQFAGEGYSSLVNEYQNLIIFRTFSKAMALAGLRLGYICASEECIKMVGKVRNPKEINKIAQFAALSLLDNVNEVKMQVEALIEEKKRFIEIIRAIGNGLTVRDSHSNFVLIQTEKYEEIIKSLANKNIYVRDRSNMHQLQNTFRITIGKEEKMREVIDVIEKILK
jgi:histidinol-phosphate aminotransferase